MKEVTIVSFNSLSGSLDVIGISSSPSPLLLEHLVDYVFVFTVKLVDDYLYGANGTYLVIFSIFLSKYIICALSPVLNPLYAKDA